MSKIEAQEPTPLDLFDEKTKDITELGELIIIVAQEGMPAIENTFLSTDTNEDKDNQYRTFLSATFVRLFENRQQNGMPNDVDSIYQSLDPNLGYWIQEFVLDPHKQHMINFGLLFGMELANILPEGYTHNVFGEKER
jgi:hypothetical protein